MYLGYNVFYITNSDVVKKLHKFNHMYGTIRALKSTSEETRLKCYMVMALHTLFYRGGANRTAS